jgi:hypothetical protein
MTELGTPQPYVNAYALFFLASREGDLETVSPDGRREGEGELKAKFRVET